MTDRAAPFRCYECGEPTTWLAPDSRCGDCTRFTPAEIRGDEDRDDG